MKRLILSILIVLLTGCTATLEESLEKEGVSMEDFNATCGGIEYIKKMEDRGYIRSFFIEAVTREPRCKWTRVK